MDERDESGREAAATAQDDPDAVLEAAEAVSGAGAASETPPDGPPEGTEGETLEMTAPTFPSEMVVNGFSYWLQKLPGGKVALKFAAVVSGPTGSLPLPPGYVFVFAADGWEDFQANVEETRVRQRRNVQVARQIPDLRLPDGVRVA